MSIVDPVEFKKLCWPDVEFYDKQREIIYSVQDNDETIVPAGNMLGKDFVADGLGAIPVGIEKAEWYTALDRGVVGGGFNLQLLLDVGTTSSNWPQVEQ